MLPPFGRNTVSKEIQTHNFKGHIQLGQYFVLNYHEFRIAQFLICQQLNKSEPQTVVQTWDHNITTKIGNFKTKMQVLVIDWDTLMTINTIHCGLPLSTNYEYIYIMKYKSYSISYNFISALKRYDTNFTYLC